VSISDEEVDQMLKEHFRDLCRNEDAEVSPLQEVRTTMAKRIFAHHLKYDIICLQEADYLEPSMFPEQYEVLLVETSHSKNGIAWNKNRFELVETIGNIMGRAFAVQLFDKESGQTLLVASGHFSGCNPYRIEKDAATGAVDSTKGDVELQTVVELFNRLDADLMLIGMDSNVTSLHPRLNIIKDAGYQMDYENYLEPTCTNPHQVLNTRIDWIALKSAHTKAVSVTNIPVLNVSLNSIQTNFSDHKPIAAKITY
jgi:endonuclease/exonuclease/phosphatase family metal-dependent hydrolase